MAPGLSHFRNNLRLIKDLSDIELKTVIIVALDLPNKISEYSAN